jgi:hypothetical protein
MNLKFLSFNKCRLNDLHLPSVAARPLSFKYTNNMEIAAGIMPAMRAVWPMVAGITALSF